MNGLEYIRISCNFSQSFLAEKLGVSRQAVNLWEQRIKPLPEKRLKQLSELFGLDKSYFGEVSKTKIKELNGKHIYNHNENGHQYYCFKVHPCWVDNPKHGTNFQENRGLLTLDEKVMIAKKEMQAVFSEIELLMYPKGSDREKSNTLVSCNRLKEIYGGTTDCINAIHLPEHEAPHRMFYYYTLMDIVKAVGLSFGALENGDIADIEESDDPYGTKPKWILQMSEEITKHIESLKDDLGL